MNINLNGLRSSGEFTKFVRNINIQKTNYYVYNGIFVPTLMCGTEICYIW